MARATPAAAYLRWSAIVVSLIHALALAGPVIAQQTAVQRGEYLARAGDCISCHTANGGAPFAGGLRLDTPFGYMLAPNITPEPETGIGRWSSADFYRALHDGVNKHGQDMYPVMPYDFYTRVTRDDIDAIYAYLRTVKPVRNNVTVNHLYFPFDQRWSMAGWRELYFSEGVYRPDPARTAAWNRGAYLVEGLGHCSDCHSPRNLLGGIEKSKDFNGAVIDGWFALDLTSDIATGLGSWSVDEIATYLKTGVYRGRTTTLGPMAEVIRNSLSSPDRRRSQGDGGVSQVHPAGIAPAHRTQGRRPHARARRRALHGQLRRLPPGSRPRPARRVPATCGQRRRRRERSRQHSQSRRRGGIPARGGFIPMPAFKDQLTDQQVAEIANYIRTSWGNAAQPNVTPAMVANMRAAKN